MLALAPDDVRMSAAAPGNTRPLAEIMPDLTARGVRAVSGQGVLGDPAGASAAEGAQLVEHMAGGLRKTLEAFLSRTPHGTCPSPSGTIPHKLSPASVGAGGFASITLVRASPHCPRVTQLPARHRVCAT
jgi:hypothetical protein